MSSELQSLLETCNMKLFQTFLTTFHCQTRTAFESPAEYDGIRVEVKYRKEDRGERIMFTVSNSDEFIFYKSSLDQLTSDFKRFLNLKAFL
jgi:hypothetical protein